LLPLTPREELKQIEKVLTSSAFLLVFWCARDEHGYRNYLSAIDRLSGDLPCTNGEVGALMRRQAGLMIYI
jgi:hypothetical protein